MFTGLVKEVGKVRSVKKNKEGILFEISCKDLISHIEVDDSVSINGACQTAVEIFEDSFVVQSIQTTLEKTTLSELEVGSDVNLELAMRLGDRLGGHIVQGHVNDVGLIRSLRNNGKSWQLIIGVSSSQMKYIVKEGSVTIDGISLTVSNTFRSDSSFEVSIIPHTFENTVLKNKRVGSRVNIEVDILGKYIENLLFDNMKDNKVTSQVMNLNWLKDQGF